VHVGRLLAVAGTGVAMFALAACGGAAGGTAEDNPNALVVYNAQHESMTTIWADGFTKETGIEVVLRHGKDFELANQIKAEGDRSPADVFLTENSPAMAVVENAGMFADIDSATLAQVPKKYSTSTGKWVGIAARSTVFVYNTERLRTEELPESIMDLAKPEWQGRWGAAPGGADFQAIVSAMLELEGEEKTEAWLQAMKVNYKNYSGNNTVLQGANSGEIDGGIIYHYYWYRDQAKTKENFITGPTGQQALADSAEFEYTVGSKVPANPALQPLSELDPPKVDPSKLNGPKVIELMSNAGLI
jgi:iron(III) transport system substrate-binding protein